MRSFPLPISKVRLLRRLLSWIMGLSLSGWSQQGWSAPDTLVVCWLPSGDLWLDASQWPAGGQFGNPGWLQSETGGAVSWGLHPDAAQLGITPEEGGWLIPAAWALPLPFGASGFIPVQGFTQQMNGAFSPEPLLLSVNGPPNISVMPPAGYGQVCGPATLSFYLTNFSGNLPSTTYAVDYGDGGLAGYAHPPPAWLNRNYSPNSCGSVTPGGAQNAHEFRITATNVCGVSTATVGPIRVHTAPTPVPTILGPQALCAGAVGTYTTTGGGTIASNEGPCTATPLAWTALGTGGSPNPTPGSGNASALATTFTAPGQYNIGVFANHPVCPDGFGVQPVCVQPPLASMAQATSTSGCFPMTVQLFNGGDNVGACGTVASLWTLSGGAFVWEPGSGPQSPSPWVTLLEPAVYQVGLEVSATGVAGCNAATSSLAIEVWGAPEVEVMVMDSVCAESVWLGEITSWENGGAPDFTWTWQLFDASGGSIMSQAGAEVALSFPAQEDFTGTVVASNACGAMTVGFGVDVRPLPGLGWVGEPGACAGSEWEMEVVWTSGAPEIGEGVAWTWESNLVPQLEGEGLGATFWMTEDLVGEVVVEVAEGGRVCTGSVGFNAEAWEVPELAWEGDLAACAGSEETVSVVWAPGAAGAAGSEFVWTLDGVVVPEEQLSGSTTVLPGATGLLQCTWDAWSGGTLEVLVQDAWGCSANLQASLVAHPVPIVDAGPDFLACTGVANLTLSGASPPGGIWSGPGIVNPVTGVWNPGAVGGGVTGLAYTLTTDQGCTASDTKLAQISAPPQVDAGPTLEFCHQTTEVVALSGATPLGGTWSGLGITDAAAGTFLPGNLPLGTQTLTYTATGPQGAGLGGSCQASDTRNVVIYGNPTAILLVSDPSVCVGDQAQWQVIGLGGSPQPGVGYQYSWSSNVNGNGNTATAWTSVPGEAVTAQVVITDSRGCSDDASSSVFVLPLPQVTASTNLTACNQPYLMPLPPASPSGGTWSGPGVQTNPVGFQPASAGLGVHNIQYTVTSVFGCSASASAVATVVEPVWAQAGADTTVCLGTVSVPFSGYSPLGGNWSGPVPVTANGASLASLASGTWTFAYTTGSGSCATTDTRDVVIAPLPTVQTTAEPSTCSGTDWMWQVDVIGGVGPWTLQSNLVSQSLSPGVWIGQTQPNSSPFQYPFSITDGLGCTTTGTLSGTLIPTPSVQAGTDTVFCAQEVPAQLAPGFPASGQFLGLGDWPATALTPSGSLSPWLVSPGVYPVAYAWTDPNSGCTGRDTLMVEINPPPTWTPPADLALCPDQGWTPIAWEPSDWTVNFSATSSEAAAALSGGGVDPQNLPAGPHVIQAAAGEETCAVTSFFTLTVIPLPEADSGQTWSFCANESPVLLAPPTFNGTTTGAWEGEGVLDAAAGWWQPPSSPESEEVAFNLSYAFSDPMTGCTGSIPVEVTMLPVPDASILGPQEACVGSEVAWDGPLNMGSTHVWDWGNGLETSPSSGATEVVFDVPGTFEVTRTVTTAEGCSSGSSVWVNVVPVPAWSIAPSVQVGCSPLEVTWLQSTEAVGGEWGWTGENWSSAAYTPPNTTVLATNGLPNEETVTVVFNHVCGDQTETWTFTALPAPEIELGWESDSLCFPEVPNLEWEVFGDPEEWTWSWNNDPGTQVPIEVIPPIPGLGPSTGGPHVLTVTVFSACGTASDAAPLWLLESAVQASGISSFSTGCAPLEVDFEFTGSDAETIQWFGSGWSAEGSSVSHTWTSPSNETVLLVAHDYCGSDSLGFPVEIFGNPSFVANGMLPAVCLGDTLFLNLEAPDLTSVEWTWGNGTFTSGSEAWVVYDEPGTYTPAVYAEFGSPGCSQGESWVVEVFDYPSISSGQTSFEGCSPLDVAIDPAIDVPNWMGTWSILPSGETSVGNSFEFTFSHTSPISNDTQWIQLVASAGPGCIASQTWPVVVYPMPEPAFEPSPFAGTWSAPDPLNMGWQFENQSVGGTDWEWSFGDGSISTLESPEHIYDFAGKFEVTLSVWNADGCSASHVEILSVEDASQVYVPNAFTPGVPMDGVNDGFKPVLSHPERFETPGSYRFEVFNRWGNHVFTTEDPNEPWLGEGLSETHFVQDDVYHWQLTLQWSQVERKIIQGSVILLRE